MASAVPAHRVAIRSSSPNEAASAKVPDDTFALSCLAIQLFSLDVDLAIRF